MNWIQVTEKMPESGEKVLAYYETACGEIRIIFAFWAAEKMLELSPEDEDADYDEESDMHFYREGWYEQIDNWIYQGNYFISEGVTHWMPLPKPPEEV